jgi:hypothetical protein
MEIVLHAQKITRVMGDIWKGIFGKFQIFFLFLFIIKILFKSYPLAVKGVPLLLVRITN